MTIPIKIVDGRISCNIHRSSKVLIFGSDVLVSLNCPFEGFLEPESYIELADIQTFFANIEGVLTIWREVRGPCF